LRLLEIDEVPTTCNKWALKEELFQGFLSVAATEDIVKTIQVPVYPFEYVPCA